MPTVALPTLWALIGLWGAVFRSDIASDGEPFHYTDWHSYPPLIGLVFFLSYAVICIKRAPASWAFSVSLLGVKRLLRGSDELACGSGDCWRASLAAQP